VPLACDLVEGQMDEWRDWVSPGSVAPPPWPITESVAIGGLDWGADRLLSARAMRGRDTSRPFEPAWLAGLPGYAERYPMRVHLDG
jgi:hypothetical protein